MIGRQLLRLSSYKKATANPPFFPPSPSVVRSPTTSTIYSIPFQLQPHPLFHVTSLQELDIRLPSGVAGHKQYQPSEVHWYSWAPRPVWQDGLSGVCEERSCIQSTNLSPLSSLLIILIRTLASSNSYLSSLERKYRWEVGYISPDLIRRWILFQSTNNSEEQHGFLDELGYVNKPSFPSNRHRHSTLFAWMEWDTSTEEHCRSRCWRVVRSSFQHYTHSEPLPSAQQLEGPRGSSNAKPDTKCSLLLLPIRGLDLKTITFPLAPRLSFIRSAFQKPVRRCTLKVIRKIWIGSWSIGTRQSNTRRRWCICGGGFWGTLYRVVSWRSGRSESVQILSKYRYNEIFEGIKSRSMDFPWYSNLNITDRFERNFDLASTLTPSCPPLYLCVLLPHR